MDSKTALRAQLDGAVFRKSTKSGPYSDNCVEVAFIEGGVAVRDSKDRGPVQVYTAAEWDAFVEGVRAGEFSQA
jgi:hypothetical protein